MLYIRMFLYAAAATTLTFVAATIDWARHNDWILQASFNRFGEGYVEIVLLNLLAAGWWVFLGYELSNMRRK